MKTAKIVKQFLRADSNAKCAEINVEAAIKIEESVICADLANNDTNMNTDTPETDAAEWGITPHDMVVRSSLAGKLERERDEARKELSEWSILNGWGGTPEIIHEFIKGQQTRIHYAQNVEEELADAIVKCDKVLSLLAYWRGISECDCSNPLPNGGCLRCDLDKVFNTTNQND